MFIPISTWMIQGSSGKIQLKKLGEYLDLYLEGDALLLDDVFENFIKLCLKIYHLDPVKILSAPGLSWQAVLKDLELLTDIYMLLMTKKGIKGGICHAIHWYAKANNKYRKDYDKNKEFLYLKYWHVSNLWQCCKSFQEINLNGLKILFSTFQDFIKKL